MQSVGLHVDEYYSSLQQPRLLLRDLFGMHIELTRQLRRRLAIYGAAPAIIA